MNEATLRLLRAADDCDCWEFPLDFDGQAARDRVLRLRTSLEQIAGRALALDNQVQDASYFAELFISEPRTENGLQYLKVTFSIPFSCFGALVTIHNENVFSAEIMDRMRVELERQKFVFIHSAELKEPYSGPNSMYHGRTWLDRFFNYA